MKSVYDELGFSAPKPSYAELGFDDEILSEIEDRPESVPIPYDEESLNNTFGKMATSGTCDMGVVKLPAPVGNDREIRVHKKLQKVMQSFVEEIHAKELWWMIRSISGYSVETRPSSQRYLADRKPSITSWGIAVTINSGYNLPGTVQSRPIGEPVTKIAAGEPGYTFYPAHPIVEIARAHGLTWAGQTHYETPEGKVSNDVTIPSVFMYMSNW